MSMKELNGMYNPERNPDILPYMHLTLKERKKVALLQRRAKFLAGCSGDHDKAEHAALVWVLGKLANMK